MGHRDLKLENVLLADNPGDPHKHILKLADFGFAANHVNTVANSKVGTYSYMAPEVRPRGGGALGLGFRSRGGGFRVRA